MRDTPPLPHGDDPNANSMSEDTRAVAEILQFSFILGIGLLVTFGGMFFAISALQDATASDVGDTAVQEMALLQTDHYDIADGTPHKTTELELPKGSVGFGEEVEMAVSVDAGGKTLDMTSTMQPVIFEYGDGAVALESGALVQHRGDADQSEMAVSPQLDIDDERTVLRMLNTTHDRGPQQLSGTELNVQVSNFRSSQSGERFVLIGPDGTKQEFTAEMTVTTPRYSGWRHYIKSSDALTLESESPGSNEITFSFETRELIVQEINISVRLE